MKITLIYILNGIITIIAGIISILLYQKLFKENPNLLFLSLIILILIIFFTLWLKRYELFFKKNIVYRNNIISLNKFDRDVIRSITKELWFYGQGSDNNREIELKVKDICKPIKEEYRIYFKSDKEFYKEILKTLTKIGEYGFKTKQTIQHFLSSGNRRSEGDYKFYFTPKFLKFSKEVI